MKYVYDVHKAAKGLELEPIDVIELFKDGRFANIVLDRAWGGINKKSRILKDSVCFAPSILTGSKRPFIPTQYAEHLDSMKVLGVGFTVFDIKEFPVINIINISPKWPKDFKRLYGLDNGRVSREEFLSWYENE